MYKENTTNDSKIVIDIPPKNLIPVEDFSQVHTPSCLEEEMPLNFELREPGETIQPILKTPVDAPTSQRETESTIAPPLDSPSTMPQKSLSTQFKDKVSLQLKKAKNHLSQIKKEKQHSTHTHTYTQENQYSTDDQSHTEQDTSFGAFKTKQYEQEKHFRISIFQTLKRIVGTLLTLVGLPILLALGIASGAILISSVALGILSLCVGLFGLGISAFLATTQPGALSSVVAYLSIFIIGICGICSLILTRLTLWVKKQLSKGFVHFRGKRKD